MTSPSAYIVGIVVDPSIGDRIHALAEKMPVWVAGTTSNRRTAEASWATHPQTPHTDPGGITVFSIDTDATVEEWLTGVLDSVVTTEPTSLV